VLPEHTPLGDAEAVRRPHLGDMAGSDYVKTHLREPFVWPATMLRTTPSTCPRHDRWRHAHAAKKFNWRLSTTAQSTRYSATGRHGFEVHVFPATATAPRSRIRRGRRIPFERPGDPSALPHPPDGNRLLRLPDFRHLPRAPDAHHALGGTRSSSSSPPRGNQPVRTSKREISSPPQNHGFATDPKSLGRGGAFHRINLNDQTVRGLRPQELPVFCVQYHPSAPGPNDADPLFEIATVWKSASGKSDLPPGDSSDE